MNSVTEESSKTDKTLATEDSCSEVHTENHQDTTPLSSQIAGSSSSTQSTEKKTFLDHEENSKAPRISETNTLQRNQEKSPVGMRADETKIGKDCAAKTETTQDEQGTTASTQLISSEKLAVDYQVSDHRIRQASMLKDTKELFPIPIWRPVQHQPSPPTKEGTLSSSFSQFPAEESSRSNSGLQKPRPKGEGSCLYDSSIGCLGHVNEVHVDIDGERHEMIVLCKRQAIRFCLLKCSEIGKSAQDTTKALDSTPDSVKNGREKGEMSTSQSQRVDMSELRQFRWIKWVKMGEEDYPLTELISVERRRRRTWLLLRFLTRKHKVWRIRDISLNFYTWDFKDRRERLDAGLRCSEWEKFFRMAIRYQGNRPKSLLVFVNPFGGKRKAKKIFEKKAKPIFELAKLKLKVIETQRANHALDTIQEMSDEEFYRFNGVVSVGGDGLFNEILHGCVMRENRGVRMGESLSRPKNRLGIIPAGSTNAVACTVYGTDDPVSAALHILLGDESGMDVCGVYQKKKLIRFCCTMASFGFLGDSLKDSETKRCLGPVRYNVSGLRTLLKHPKYFGRVEFSPVFDEQKRNLEEMRAAFRATGSQFPVVCHSDCNTCETILTRSLSSGDTGVRSRSCEVYRNHVTDEFNHVVGAVTPCLSPMSPHGLSPSSHIGDGTMDLGLVAGISRTQNAKFLLDAMSKGAHHVKHKFVHMFRVSGFSYTPGAALETEECVSEGDVSMRAVHICPQKKRRKADAKGCQGTWNLDGELLEQPMDTLHFRVHRQLVRLFARGIELKDASSPICGCCRKEPVVAKQYKHASLCQTSYTCDPVSFLGY